MGGRKLKDSYNRDINYMRISVIPHCNLSCCYCMPSCKDKEDNNILSIDEIFTVCKEAAELGIKNFRITGGEPLLREGCIDLIGRLKDLKGVEGVTLTTNGILLEKYADLLYKSGIDGINISLDTLDRERYKKITGFDGLDSVMRGIELLTNYSVPIKLNSVIIKGVNEEDFDSLVNIAKNNNITVRFIELMPIGRAGGYKGVSNKELLKKLENAQRIYEKKGNGPAVYYSLEGYKGKIGFISPINDKFCNSCNRIRLTSDGFLKGCLASKSDINVKSALQNGGNEVRELIERAIYNKPKEHSFENGITENRNMCSIGG